MNRPNLSEVPLLSARRPPTLIQYHSPGVYSRVCAELAAENILCALQGLLSATLHHFEPGLPTPGLNPLVCLVL